MGLSSALDWWDEWKLRILVLCSFVLQFVLIFSGFVRNSYVLRRLRVIVWLAYIGGDALAVYALATLFNRQKQKQTASAADGGGGSSALEVIWAPVLLIHLGGPMHFSAYSLEDNELWKRHAITLVSQVAVALYVFCKWWSGETRLLQAAVLLFIFGILRYSEKPWALRRASYGGMTSTYLTATPRRSLEEESSSLWHWLGKLCTTALFITCSDFREIRAQLMEEVGEGVGEIEATNYSLEEYVRKAQEQVKEAGQKGTDEAQLEELAKFKWYEAQLGTKYIYKMFLDLSAPYSIRLPYLKSFLNLDGNNQHEVLRQWIALQFFAIYTKLRSTVTCLGACTLLVLPSLALASAVLFAKGDKDGYYKSDITVTYILFFGTVVMELTPFFVKCLSLSLVQCNLLCLPITWQDMVAQHNVMSFCARKKKPPTLMKLATFSYLRNYINKHWYIRHQCVAKQISVLVHRHAEYGWKEYIHDPATYRSFNNLRGDHTLRKHHLLDQDMRWTFDRPFDEYVLLWHIATDLCLHHPCSSTNNTTTASSSQSQDTIENRRSSSEIISNYMIYLLFICPDMLIPGVRQDLFIVACDGIERIVKDQPLPSLDERSIAQRVFSGMGQAGNGESTMISDAYKLAKRLIELENDMKLWQVIQGVWVEMLCYSASRCRGYVHAKSLGVAPEFLTNVWLLWWFMGMQTLPDMMNNLGSPEEQTAAASV